MYRDVFYSIWFFKKYQLDQLCHPLLMMAPQRFLFVSTFRCRVKRTKEKNAASVQPRDLDQGNRPWPWSWLNPRNQGWKLHQSLSLPQSQATYTPPMPKHRIPPIPVVPELKMPPISEHTKCHQSWSWPQNHTTKIATTLESFAPRKKPCVISVPCSVCCFSSPMTANPLESSFS